MNILAVTGFSYLNTELNPICHLLVLLGTYPISHISRIRVKLLTIVQLFFYVLKFYLDTILYSQCTNLCLLRSDVVNYFLGRKYCIF